MVRNTFFDNLLITHTFTDEEGNLWVTSFGQGVFLSPTADVRLYDSRAGLPVDQVSCLSKGFKSDLWIGLHSGYYVNMINDSLRAYRLKGHENRRVTSIKTFDKDKILIATKSNIALRSNSEIGYFNFFSNDILVDDGYVYSASKQFHVLDSAFFFSKITKEPEVNDAFQHTMEGLMQLRINSGKLCKGNGKEIFLGTQKGLYMWNGEQAEKVENRQDESLLSSPVNDLLFDAKRNLLFVATNTRGLLVMRNNNVVMNCTVDEGLSGNNCQSLLLDGNTLWIGTSKSLDLMVLDSGKVDLINFGGSLNLKTTKILDTEKVNNELYLATDIGLMALNPGNYLEHKVAPRLYVISFKANSNTYTTDGKLIELDYDQNTITCDFLGISFKNLGNLSYKYRLNGYQESWQTTKRKNVVFQSLIPGSYAFEVKAVGADNLESNSISVSFVIAQPYWQTTWFRLLIVVLVLFVGMSIWFVRIRRIRRRYELEKKIVAGELEKLELEKAYLLAELKAGVMQMNPHFLFNSLNTIKGYYAQNRFQEANRFISRFSKLLRLILECNTQLIPLQKEIEILTLYLDLMQKRYDGVFEFNIVSTVPEKEKIKLPPMLLQPIVENAIIHGIAPMRAGKVSVSFYQSDGWLMCKVKDNGVGFNNSGKQVHQSVGLKNIKDRLKLLSEQFKAACNITVTSPDPETGKGTVVILQFPLEFTDYHIK